MQTCHLKGKIWLESSKKKYALEFSTLHQNIYSHCLKKIFTIYVYQKAQKIFSFNCLKILIFGQNQKKLWLHASVTKALTELLFMTLRLHSMFLLSQIIGMINVLTTKNSKYVKDWLHGIEESLKHKQRILVKIYCLLLHTNTKMSQGHTLKWNKECLIWACQMYLFIFRFLSGLVNTQSTLFLYFKKWFHEGNWLFWNEVWYRKKNRNS